MIIAKLLGGPHDGSEVATPELTPLVFPNFIRPWWECDEEGIATITYVPMGDTLQPCDCCSVNRTGWTHTAASPSVDLTSITYSRHYECVYVPAGYNR